MKGNSKREGKAVKKVKELAKKRFLDAEPRRLIMLTMRFRPRQERKERGKR